MLSTALLYGLAASITLPLTAALAPIKNEGVLADLVIPDTYIVKYKPSADILGCKDHEKDVDARAKKANRKGIVGNFDMPGLQGYIAEISPSELADLLIHSPLIDYIEKDTIVKTATSNTPRTKHNNNNNITRQHPAPWNLARISHRTRKSPNNEYPYHRTAGAAIPIYVLDTGIRLTHRTFSSPSRAVWGANFIASSPDTDEDGHGTHVAGVIAGSTHGVAKRAVVVAVKVLDRSGTGSTAGVVRALDWVVADARRRGEVGRAVVNMSVSGEYSQAVNDAVAAAVREGVTVVVAAGNEGVDVKGVSPGSAEAAITVGAVDERNERAAVSNWGVGVDIFAPGVGIVSAYNGSDVAEETMSGTSMAAPHVAGLAAYFIAKEGLSGSAEVMKRILSVASKGVGDRKDGADRIAYNDSGE
jgi:subtilisin family serine protease